MKIFFDTFPKKYNRPPRNEFPTGSRVYKGYQGSGKSLSMCFYALQMAKQFPNCVIFSNMIIRGIKNFVFIENDEILKQALEYRNGRAGVLILLDEAHL